ncbi:phage tail tape measure protein [Mesorhizobium sp. M8A.F.Ca.ET.208.01.1.1]|uniref:phage tail tape measure protein n=1 Tax=unclassified Mesorhizobium TaxID=325217 RepID=UPI001093E78F|nr:MULTISPECIES: phage tail tape measure protein [unclassified Mesorhizobium]TGQ92183.1 phage tail tape measure protein [Mesorhizobium sp. M8A.F.Ca.ET.208.01.1.1]TGT52083.1 phage tail tape measure protein [Mesorhizobium sp. M8A.F.Ca.ET.167.01.1.1]
MANLTSQLLVRLIDGVSVPARAAARSLLGIGNAARSINGVQTNLRDAIERNNAALDRARGRMLDASAAGYALYRALKAPIEAGVEFQTQLEDIGQKAEIPQARLAALGQQIRRVARDTNQAASKMAQGLDTLVGFGASENDALGLLQPIGRAATAYRAEIDDLARAGYAALDNLKVPADQFGRALDAMAKSGKEGAFELRDMAQYFPSLGAAYQALGQKGVPAVADLSAALQIARKGAGDSAEAANNLRNVLQKINSPQTRKAFKKMGVDLTREMKKLAKKGYTPLEAIAEITNKTLKGDLGKIGDLFQDAQVQAGLRPLIQNIEEYRRIRKEALAAQGTVEEDYQRRLKTTLGTLQRFQATIETMNTSIGAALLPGLSEYADKLGTVAAKVADFADAYPQLTSNLVQAGAALISFRVALAGLSFLGLNLRGALLTIALGIANIGGRAIVAAKNAVALQRALGAMSGQKLGAFGTFATALRGMIFAVPGVSMIASALAAVGSALAAITAPAWGLIALGVAAVAAAGALLWKYWDRITSVLSGVASAFAEELAPAIKAIQPVLDLLRPVGEAIAAGFDKARAALSAFGDWIGSFFSREVLSEDQKAQWATAGHDAAIRMIEAIKSVFSGLVEWAASLGAQIGNAIASAASAAIGKLRSYLPSFGGAASPAASAGSQVGALAGHRAGGGPVRAGGSYLVGERGPEVVTMGRSGHVRPNSSLGGAALHQTNNITISGVAGDLRELADQIGHILEKKTEMLVRGLHADYS